MNAFMVDCMEEMDEFLDDGSPVFASNLASSSVEQDFLHSSQLIAEKIGSGPNSQPNIYNAAWVNVLQRQHLNQVKLEGYKACLWANALEKWKTVLAEVPFEEIEIGGVRSILAHARLTPNPQPTFYETLRKLGKDILCKEAENETLRKELVERLFTPGLNDSFNYFGTKEKWIDDSRSLANHLEKLHALYGSLPQELLKEEVLGFVVSHIRSDKYHPVELAAIIKHLIHDIPASSTQHWSRLSDDLENENTILERIKELRNEAQSFIMRCFENMYRARQSFEGAEKRNSAVGVILFGDISADSEHETLEPSLLDKWYEDQADKAEKGGVLETSTLKQIRNLIKAEQELWEKWETNLKSRKGPDFKISKQALFTILSADQLFSSSLVTQLTNSIKAYCEKKKGLRELAEKSSRKTCVLQAIKDANNDASSRSINAPHSIRKIAVFGYRHHNDGKGVPEAAEQSIIVRAIPLTRKYTGEEATSSDQLDARLFEIGVSLAGTYISFCPNDRDDLEEMFRTSGLGLGQKDEVEFFQFIPQGQHWPGSKSIDAILKPASVESGSYSHILLTIPDAPSRQNLPAYCDIADAGGRFFIDLKRVGACKTDGMRYTFLAVEPAASVALDNDGKTKAFRRLAVLLPPSMPNEMPSTYHLGKLGMEGPRGSGFQESAEIIAEVLSLAAIDKSKMDDNVEYTNYRSLIKNHLEGNALLLYYTSIELLNTVDLTFSRIIAEFWEDKLKVGQRNLSRDEQESRRLVLGLITSGVQRLRVSSNDSAHHPGPVTNSTAQQSRNGGGDHFHQQTMLSPVGTGKRIALATEAHLRLLPGIIQRETHFSQQDIFVEESNFESVLLRLKGTSPTSLTFIFVYITGRISVDQVSQLVSIPASPTSAIKLIFRYSASLASLLDLTPSVRDVIYRPESINDALTNKMKIIAYTNKTAVGAMLLYNTKQLSQDPSLICKSGIYWDNKYPEMFVKTAASWKSSILEWALKRLDDSDMTPDCFRILVSFDHCMSSELLQKEINQLNQPQKELDQFNQPILLRVVDAGARSAFEDLKAFLDCKVSASFSFSSVNNTTTQIQNASLEHPQALEILILCRSSFFPHCKLEALLSHCYSRRIKVLLMANEPSSSISRFRVFKDDASPPTWVRIPVIIQREYCSRSETPRVNLAFKGLQLLFSHDAVISNEHLLEVEKFLENSASGSNDGGFLELLDHIEGVPIDTTLKASIVSALALVDETGSGVWSGDDKHAKKAVLGEVLAMHINAYLRFPKHDAAFSISFNDFCRQPRVRFLSQIHRVEAYMCYIFSKTLEGKRHCSSANLQFPLGFPISVCFKFNAACKNIHMASNPGILLTATFEKHASLHDTSKITMREPYYIDPGRGDVVTHLQEMAERRAISGSEMHWEEMYTKWESGPDINEEILDHILSESPSRISVLLSMTPPQIVNLSPSAKALEEVAMDFENVEASLRQTPVDFQISLRVRTAAISWLLLTKREDYSLRSEDNFIEDQSLLTKHGIFINTKDDPSDMDNERTIQILARVTKALIQLDTADTLTVQHSVREFLLSNAHAELIGNILNISKVKIGQALISACVARGTLNLILSKAAGSAVCDRIGSVLKWVKESSTASVENMRRDMEFLSSRITPEALASLLINANPPLDLEKAREGIIEPYLMQAEKTYGCAGAASMLDQVLTCVCNDTFKGLAVELFDVLTRSATKIMIDLPVPDFNSLAPTWHEMFWAMKDPSRTQSLLQSAHAHKFVLPFEVSKRLCELYVNHFCIEGRDVMKDIDQHAMLVRTDLSRDAIYKFMMDHIDLLSVNLSTMALVWFTWWSRPWSSFPPQFLPKRESWEIFQNVMRKLNINEERTAQGLSIIAKFTLAPHTLPASIANALKFAMVSDEPLVVSSKYVLAQYRSNTFPVYGFRMHSRHLPRECIELITNEVKKRKLRGFTASNKQENLKALFPITDSGVSVELALHNLNILVYIHESEQSVQPDSIAIMRAQIFLPTLAWFYAAGFDRNDLKFMLDEEEKNHLARNHVAMASIWQNPDFPAAPVYFPLPVYIDVRFVYGKPGTLLQCNPESTSITVQWLSMLGLQYELDLLPLAEQFNEYALCRRSGRPFDAELPKTVIWQTMKDVAKVLAQRHKDVEIADAGIGKHHIVFVLDDSGSMAGRAWESVVASVRDFLNVRLLIGAEDRISLIAFNDKARTLCKNMPIEDCSQNLETLLRFQGGGTNFAPALQEAHAVLNTDRSTDPTYKPVLLFMSDGGCRHGDAEMQTIARDFSPSILVRTIAFGAGADPVRLRNLARIANGEFEVAATGDDMRRRFTAVAAALARSTSSNASHTERTSSEVQGQKEIERNGAVCSKIVDDCIPLADFFAQLRDGSQSFARFAFDGLAEGLKDACASQALQVCIADALYLLIGVTPVNSGLEVLHLLKTWESKELTIGSSVVMELRYMASEVYERFGLTDLANSLRQHIGGVNPALKRVPYVRNPASVPLATALKEPTRDSDTNTYSFNSCKLIACPGRIHASCPGIQQTGSNLKPILPSRLREADFDHAKGGINGPEISSGLHPNTPLTTTRNESHEPVQRPSLFRCAATDAIYAYGQKLHFQDKRVSGRLTTKPRTISARELVAVDTGPATNRYWGYAVVRIVPGLHPILKSPGDSQSIPVSQQKSLGRLRERESLDREDHMKSGNRAKIEAIFSNNGGTWENLNQMPVGSTIMGRGFYLRKSQEGWVFLVTAMDCSALEKPPYLLWTILDTLKLAALDFADMVIETLKAIVTLAYMPDACACDDDEIADILNEIRSLRDNGEDEYLKYLEREYIVCQHLLLFMNKARTESSGTLLIDIFDPDSLEQKLHVQVGTALHGILQIVGHLSQFIGLRDWVPRSQLTFTLELVLANHPPRLASENLAARGDSFEDEESSAMRNFWALDANEIRGEAVNNSYGTSFPKNKLIAAHEHITQRKFHQQSLQIIQDIEKRKALFNPVDWTNLFLDSDDEESELSSAQLPVKTVQPIDDSVIKNAQKERGIANQRCEQRPYEDDEFDMARGISANQQGCRNGLFPSQWGYGRAICSPFCVPSLFDDPVPLYFVQVDVRRLKISYSDADGLPIAFLFHKRLLDRSLKAFLKIEKERRNEQDGNTSDDSHEGDRISPKPEDNSDYQDREGDPFDAFGGTRIEDTMLAYREELLHWLTDLIRSPLPNNAKDWFLDKLENGATACCVPLLSDKECNDNVGGDLNLMVIAHCIGAASPSPNACNVLFRTAFHIAKDFLPFCKRKNDIYGVHIVRGGTLEELRQHGAVVEVCPLGYDALTGSKDNASMYLTIIGHFSTSKFTWLVYVTGLDHIDDALLKWLAEYTKAHPWRFIYLENTQTSWNFSENRDRCIYDRAPIPVERTIRIEADLQKPEVNLLRPTHTQPYPRITEHCHEFGTDEQKLQAGCTWEQLSQFTRTFFTDKSKLAATNEPASKIKVDWSSVCDPACKTDYRQEMRQIFNDKDPCVVLLCSPPGAGKSHFSNELAEMTKRSLGIGRAFIDGSDDRLVDMALTEILNLELPDSSKSHFLVVDEFHMLKEHHKQDLFRWLEINAKRLHVLLIANRKDANDEKLLFGLKDKVSAVGISEDRILSLSTRLGNELLDEVMQKRRTDQKTQIKIRRWMHCCRCLFGGEAVSLRAITALDEKLKSIDYGIATDYDLVNLLLDKMPMISEATAREFVAAFSASFATKDDPIESIVGTVKGPISLMVQAALLTEDYDLKGMDYPDFVAFGVDRAYDAPPALRIAAWCCHMRFHMSEQQERTKLMDEPQHLFQWAFVDQCGFPLQLEESPSPHLRLSEGLAFSWGGDYSRLPEIIDAVRHGHSVDWADVHRRCWSCEPVQDSKLFIELLSVSTSPGKVLNALRKDNLCSLLKKSSPEDSLRISTEILKHQTHLISAKADRFLSPYRTAVWLTLCYNKALHDVKGILDRIGTSVTGSESPCDDDCKERNGLDWRENELVEALTWACTHMTDMITCRSDDDPLVRTQVLKTTLVYLTQKLICQGDNVRATSLWGGMFAPLLRVSRGKTRGSESTDAAVVAHVAIHADDACVNWQEPLPLLWAIAHGKGTAVQVADVWSRYPYLLLEEQEQINGPLHPKFAAGVLCVADLIPTDLQVALLTRGGSVDLDLIADRLDHAVNQVRGAVESLVKGEGEDRIALVEGPFKDLVLSEAKRVRDEYDA